MLVSIIIPTLNEEKNIARLLDHLLTCEGENEIIVVDGESEDNTAEVVGRYGKVKMINSPRGRAIQMNRGVDFARGDILYFVHADTLPPSSFYNDIGNSINNGCDLGCYRFKFDRVTSLMKINNFFTRFNKSWARGGDQSLFIRREMFTKLGGYDESYVIMEEYDLLREAKKAKAKFEIIPKNIIVSARKYDDNSYFRVQIANLVVFTMFNMRVPSHQLLKTYRVLLNYRA